MTAETRADIYSRITAEIVAAIEAGAGEWHMPWHHSGGSPARPTNVASGRPYRGVDTLALWIAAQSHGYASGVWGTYRQWQALGAQVRKGERSTAIVFWKRIGTAQDQHDVEDADEHPRLIVRGYAVFNCNQVDGYQPPAVDALPAPARIPHAEAFIAALGIPATLDADAAYYRVDLDRIFMPAFASFEDPPLLRRHVHP
jgi:antirestriction protein ArdC